MKAELDPNKSSHPTPTTTFFFFFIGDNHTLTYWICMANGSLRAVVYAEGASNGADPLGFHSPAFTQNVQANMSAGATAAGGAQQCLYVHPAAAAHLRRKRRKKNPWGDLRYPLLMQAMQRHKGLQTKFLLCAEKDLALSSCPPSRFVHLEILASITGSTFLQCLQAGTEF